MLSIFDQAHGTASALRLLQDALFSLSRQWTVRPEFWHDLSPAAPPQPTCDGIPSFYTISPFRPRSAAVINGLVLSLGVFCMTCFAIRYSWIHVLHVRIPEVHFERPSWIPPKGTSGTSPTLQKTPIPAPPQNRTPPVASATPALSQVPPPGAVAPQRHTARAAGQRDTARPQFKPRVSNQQARTASAAEPPLKSYEGTYVVDSPANLRIVITVEDENLMMSMSGQTRLILAPMSETKFVVQGIENCWIEFAPGSGTMGDESAPQLQLSCDGQRYTARRQP
jgi:hypothetical protein